MSRARLSALEPRTTTEQALALFDALPSVRAEDILGTWKGHELSTGHPMDGVLEHSGWYGKRFDSLEKVHPLLVTGANGSLFSMEPRKVPLKLVAAVPRAIAARTRPLVGLFQPYLKTDKPRARLRNLEYRGVSSAAMIYDHLPIIDVFRRVDDDTLLGAMDLRGVKTPYFFVLARDS
ncbi:MAG: DUF4334 domain-containing protein [Kofleriaceae bacterium]